MIFGNCVIFSRRVIRVCQLGAGHRKAENGCKLANGHRWVFLSDVRFLASLDLDLASAEHVTQERPDLRDEVLGHG
jgi:hypothetical protein